MNKKLKKEYVKAYKKKTINLRSIPHPEDYLYKNEDINQKESLLTNVEEFPRLYIIRDRIPCNLRSNLIESIKKF